MVELRTVKDGMYVIKRNMQLCSGDGCKKKCFGPLPPLKHGKMRIAGWALEHNRDKMQKVMDDCKSGAIRIDEL